MQGYSVKFSPFEEDKIAVATSQNFGIIGNGKQYVLQVGRLKEGAELFNSQGRLTGQRNIGCRHTTVLAYLQPYLPSHLCTPKLL